MATSDQSQSLFFTKLPYDIREEVYKLLLTGPPIHIERRDRQGVSKLSYFRCLKPTAAPIEREDELRKYYKACVDLRAEQRKSTGRIASGGILPFLTLCKRM
jgi:hypothetical protein